MKISGYTAGDAIVLREIWSGKIWTATPESRHLTTVKNADMLISRYSRSKKQEKI
jgi:hypothetical protein